MRTIWPPKSPYYLSGEIDKSEHPLFIELEISGTKPDLLVHQQASMSDNYAVIEVKSFEAKLSALETDLKKLSLLQNMKGQSV